MTQNKNLGLQIRLAEYVKAGGTVILTFRSPMRCTINQLEATFKHFNRHWKIAMLGFNPAMKDFLGDAGSQLQRTYATNAINLLGVADHEKFYIPYLEHSSSVKLSKHENGCSTVFAQVGAGLFGYIGEHACGSRARDIMKAMIGKLLNLRVLCVNAGPFRPSISGGSE